MAHWRRISCAFLSVLTSDGPFGAFALDTWWRHVHGDTLRIGESVAPENADGDDQFSAEKDNVRT